MLSVSKVWGKTSIWYSKISCSIYMFIKSNCKLSKLYLWKMWIKTSQWIMVEEIKSNWSISNPKERQCQRMLKLPHNCTHLTHSKVQNSPSQPSAIHEPWTSRCSSWFYKKQRNQRSNCQHPLDLRKSKRVPEKHQFLFYWLCQSLLMFGSQ